MDPLACAIQTVSFNRIALGELVEKHNLFSLVKPLYVASYKYGTVRVDTKQPHPSYKIKRNLFLLYKIFMTLFYNQDLMRGQENVPSPDSEMYIETSDQTGLKILSGIVRKFALLSQNTFLPLIQLSHRIFVTSHFFFIGRVFHYENDLCMNSHP